MNLRFPAFLLGASAIALVTIPRLEAIAIAAPCVVLASLMGLLSFAAEVKGRAESDPVLTHISAYLTLGGYAILSLSILQILSVERPTFGRAGLLAGGAGVLYTYALLKMASSTRIAAGSRELSRQANEHRTPAAIALALFTYGAALPVCISLAVAAHGRPIEHSGLSHLAEPWGASLLFIALTAAYFIRLAIRAALTRSVPRLRKFTLLTGLAFLLISTIVEVLLRNNWYLYSLAIVAVAGVAIGILAVQSGAEASSAQPVLDVSTT